MSHAATLPRPDWSERLFAAVPVAPWLQGSALALLLVAFLALLAWVSGDLLRLSETGDPLWLNRDARLAVVVCLLSAAVATALCYHARGTRADLLSVGLLASWRAEEIDPAAEVGEGARDRTALVFGFALVPLIALLVDRDPALYFAEGYWSASKVWTWLLGGAAIGGLSVLVRRAIRDARHFSRLAELLPSVDLLAPASLAPFARQGLRAMVPGLLGTTVIALNAGDRDFVWAVSVLGGLNLVGGGLGMAIPLRGVRQRVRRAKTEELERTHAAIRGEPAALSGSPLESRDDLTLGDLLAWRSEIARAPEWPLDLSILRRYGLYLLIPLVSWIGGALMERLLDSVLG